MAIDPEALRAWLSSRHRRDLSTPTLQRAAVLVLLYERQNRLHVLLTRRTDRVEHHKGQISFPGGAADFPGEESVVTALREAEEEVGLPPSACSVLGLFDDLQTPSGFCITPVIALAASLPQLRPNPHEVEEILHVPLSIFLDPSQERVEQRVRDGASGPVYFYAFGAQEIWGATAAVLRSFLHAALSAEAPSGHRVLLEL